MEDAYFLYMFELPQGQNARGTMDRFREGIRAFFVGHGLDYGMGALGGTSDATAMPGGSAARRPRLTAGHWPCGRPPSRCGDLPGWG